VEEVLLWRKQDEPKHASATAEAVVSPIPQSPREPAPPASEPEFAGAILSQGIVIKGEIFGDEDILLDGEVTGAIRIPGGIVTVGQHGRVQADIEARDVLVRGSVEGALRAKERVVLEETARVRGEIVARRVVIQEGAEYRGKVEMVLAEEVRASRAVASGSAGTLQSVPARTGIGTNRR